jgi:hypothetical protein
VFALDVNCGRTKPLLTAGRSVEAVLGVIERQGRKKKGLAGSQKHRSYLRELGGYFLLQVYGFNPEPVHVRSVVEKVTLKQVLVRLSWVLICCSYITTFLFR